MLPLINSTGHTLPRVISPFVVLTIFRYAQNIFPMLNNLGPPQTPLYGVLFGGLTHHQKYVTSFGEHVPNPFPPERTCTGGIYPLTLFAPNAPNQKKMLFTPYGDAKLQWTYGLKTPVSNLSREVASPLSLIYSYGSPTQWMRNSNWFLLFRLGSFGFVKTRAELKTYGIVLTV